MGVGWVCTRPIPSPSPSPSPDTLQVAVLVVSVHWQAQFEWYAHEKLARKAGVAEAALPLIRAGAPPAALEGVLLPDEVAVYQLAQELMTTRRVSAATFAAAKQVLQRARLMHAAHARCMHTACTLHARSMHTLHALTAYAGG